MMDEERSSSIDEMIQEIPAAYQHPDLWIYQIDSSDIIVGLENILRSKYWNREDNKWETKGEPWMNEEGIGVMLGIVATHLSKEKILTDVSKERIDMMCLEIAEDIILNLLTDWEKYDVEPSKLDIIVDIIDHYVYMNLSRSVGGRTLEYFKPTIKRVEKITPQEEKRSMFGWLPFFGGK